MEYIANHCLFWTVESTNILSYAQCGFWHHESTVDNLENLEHNV
jgi:hypothetical protein